MLRQGSKVALLSFGTRLADCLAPPRTSMRRGFRRQWPTRALPSALDHDLIRQLARHHEVLVTIEEGAAGGFGAHVLHFLADSGLLDRGLKVRTMVLPDLWMEQARPDVMYAKAGLDRAGILKTVFARSACRACKGAAE